MRWRKKSEHALKPKERERKKKEKQEPKKKNNPKLFVPLSSSQLFFSFSLG